MSADIYLLTPGTPNAKGTPQIYTPDPSAPVHEVFRTYTTATRPAANSVPPGTTILNTTTNTIQASNGTIWIDPTPSGGDAPASASYIVQVPNGALGSAQALSTLSTGLLKNTTITGVLTIAVAGTDYLAPAAINQPATQVLVGNGTGLTSSANFIVDNSKVNQVGHFWIGDRTGDPTAYYNFQFQGVSAAGLSTGIYNTAPAGITSINCSSDQSGPAILSYGSTAVGTGYFGLTAIRLAVFTTFNSSAFALGTSDANPLVLGTNNTERMRIKSDGTMRLSTPKVTHGSLWVGDSSGDNTAYYNWQFQDVSAANGITSLGIYNTTPTGSATLNFGCDTTASYLASYGSQATGTDYGSFNRKNSTWLLAQGDSATGAGYLALITTNIGGTGTAGPIIFAPNQQTFPSSNGYTMMLDANQNVRVGYQALATGATNGFLYIAGMAGTPSGTPTAVTGLYPVTVDSTHNALNWYNGAWYNVHPDGPEVTLTYVSGGTTLVDASKGSVFNLTLTNTTTQIGAPSNPSSGQRIIFRIIQDATGSRLVTWNAAYRFSSTVPAPTLSTGANKYDLLEFTYNNASSVWDCVLVNKTFN